MAVVEAHVEAGTVRSSAMVLRAIAIQRKRMRRGTEEKKFPRNSSGSLLQQSEMFHLKSYI